MKPALILAAAAMLAAPFALVQPAAAQRVCVGCASYHPPVKGGGGTTYEPGEEFNPFAADRLRDQLGDGDPTLPGYVAGLGACKTELGGLSRVRAKSIDAVEQGVSVVAICTDRNLMDQQQGVPSIRAAIHGNDTMRKALRDAGAYSANDVVAVVLDGKGAKLYVHRNRDAKGLGGGGETALY